MGQLRLNDRVYTGQTSSDGFHIYSTNEQIVGKWIDGSVVYEKTFTKTSSIGSSNSITHGISNLNKVISATGGVKLSSGSWQAINDNAPSGYQIRYTGCNATQLTIEIGNQRTTTATEIIVTLRYTKTTS